MMVFIQKIVHDHQRSRQMAVFPKRKDSLSVKYPTESVNGSLFQQKTVHLLFQAKITNGSLLREDGLFHLKIPQAVSKWQSLSAEDSLLTFLQQGLQMAVSPNRRQFVPLAVSKWQSLSAEDSLLTFLQQGLQMAVFSQEKTVCLLNTQRDRQMAVSSNSLSVSGMFSSPQSRRMAVFLLGKQFVDSPGTSRRMAVFTPKTVRPPSNKVISPSKERGPT